MLIKPFNSRVFKKVTNINHQYHLPNWSMQNHCTVSLVIFGSRIIHISCRTTLNHSVHDQQHPFFGSVSEIFIEYQLEVAYGLDSGQKEIWILLLYFE